MTRQADVTSINCTSCGAGLDVLGGGRVQTHVCGYCGSQLDAQDHYKVLQQYKDLKRPESPFQLGMTGTIAGVDYTVIGTLGFEERYQHQTWQWVDHQLFSPTHGYAFLTVEKGHFIFSRAYRKATSPRWISTNIVENAESPPSISSGSDRYRYYDSSQPVITFAEGEFNWQPKIGDRSSVVSLMSTDAVLAFSKSATEEEIIRSTYPDQLEIAESFGITYAPVLEGIHRLQPYVAFVHKPFMRKVSLIGMVACFVIYIGALFGGGSTAWEDSVGARAFPLSIPVPIETANRISKISLNGNFDNSWTYFDIAVFDPDGEPIFESGRTISYYSGRDSDGSWTEGRRSASLRFRPRVPGTHTLEVGIGEQESRRAFSELQIKVTEGQLVARWFLFAGLLLGLLWIFSSLGQARHFRNRWKGWDWND